MSKTPTERPHAQTAEDKKPAHYLADWWIYAVLGLFICGLIFLTYAVILRGEVMTEFGKPAAGSAPAQGNAAASADKN